MGDTRSLDYSSCDIVGFLAAQPFRASSLRSCQMRLVLHVFHEMK